LETQRFKYHIGMQKQRLEIKEKDQTKE